jgi:glucokinase
MAGEIGFSIVDDRMSSLETQVSGPAMEAKGKTAFANPEMSLHDMMDRYYKNDDQAIFILNEAVRALAREVHHTLLLLDPHVIVLGGGVFNNHPRLVEAVKKELADYLQHPLFKGKEQRIEPSVLKGDAGLWGAYFRFGGNKRNMFEEKDSIYYLTNEV